MGADFIYGILPKCELTAERMAAAKEHIRTHAVDDNCGGDEEDLARDAASRAITAYPAMKMRRDVAVLCLADSNQVDCLLTGGMSWGDAPTDACDLFNSIEAIDGLWALLFSWAKEDLAAKEEAP
jgi:hypothetical protein